MRRYLLTRLRAFAMMMANHIPERRGVEMAETAKAKKGAGDKAAALKRIAEGRVPKAVKAIGLVSNLARYKPTAAQSTAILGALRDAVKRVEAAFAGREETAEGFKLPS